MELKEMILTTLAELEEDFDEKEEVVKEKEDKKHTDSISVKNLSEDKKEIVKNSSKISSEKVFYENLREKILVLFEGFQSPNNKNLEAKMDLTLNFLEYLLALLDDRLEAINNRSR